MLKEEDSKMYQLYSNYHEKFLDSKIRLKGKLLTLIDAAFSDPVQRKAVKDLVHQEMDSSWVANERELLIYLFRELTKGTEDELFSIDGSYTSPPNSDNKLKNKVKTK